MRIILMLLLLSACQSKSGNGVASNVSGGASTSDIVDPNAVVLLWSKNTEADLAGYKIYYHKEGGTTLNVDAGNPPDARYVMSGLEVGKKYYFSISAYDKSNNESAKTAEISKIVGSK